MTSPTNNPARPPFDPWQSCLVEASAGSGKTWQISRRFLALVMAGADPASILATTFTNKAAAEMRERVIRDAVRLGAVADAPGGEFDQFYESVKAWAPKDKAPLVRTPRETSDLILSQTQALKIVTIDSLFIQWAQRFPVETALRVNDQWLRSPWELISGKPFKDLRKQAWLDVLNMAATAGENRALIESISQNAPDGNIKSLDERVSPLINSETFLWYVQATRGHDPFHLYDIPEDIPDSPEFLSINRARFDAVAGLISNAATQAAARSMIAAGDFEGLFEIKFLARTTGLLSGQTFRSQKAKDDPAFAGLNDALSEWHDLRRAEALNRSAILIRALYNAQSSAIHKRKIAGQYGTFNDAAMGANLLARGDEFEGARALAWSGVSHLMLDEFQDTSRLQWSIFECLARELLSGQSTRATSEGPAPTVFIVGDKKQSIYRFREAAPEVIDLASKTLSPLGMNSVSMSYSFRSTEAILSFVNYVFKRAGSIDQFPEHAVSPENKQKNPELFKYGSVTLYDPSPLTTGEIRKNNKKDGKDSPLPLAQEAATIAGHIEGCLNGSIPIQVFCEKTHQWRQPRASDFAVLYPTKTAAALYENALRDKGISSVLMESSGFFARPEIQDLTALIRWMVWPADSVALAAVLRSPMFSVPDEVIQKSFPLNSSMPLVEALRPVSGDLCARLDALRSLAAGSSLATTLTELFRGLNIPMRYFEAFGGIEGKLARANTLKWLEMCRSHMASGSINPHDWLSILEELGDENETGNASIGEDMVTLMTIHKSKGLEFPCVIVANCGGDWHQDDKNWIKDSREGREGVWYIGSNKNHRPARLPQFNDVMAINTNASRAEKARLLYVALTRASQHVVLTSSELNPEFAHYQTLVGAFGDLNAQTTQAIALDNCFPGTIKILGTTGSNQVSDAESKKSAPELMPNAALSLRAPVKILAASSFVKSSPESGQLPTLSRAIPVPDGYESAYGTLVHKMLELRVMARSAREEHFARLIRAEAKVNFDESIGKRLIAMATNEVDQLTGSDSWREIFTGVRLARAELPVAAIENQTLITAKIDLLLTYHDGRHLIVDYKTSAVRPEHARDLCDGRGYTDQVRQYVDIAKKALRATNVTGAILFTESGHLERI